GKHTLIFDKIAQNGDKFKLPDALNETVVVKDRRTKDAPPAINALAQHLAGRVGTKRYVSRHYGNSRIWRLRSQPHRAGAAAAIAAICRARRLRSASRYRCCLP